MFEFFLTDWAKDANATIPLLFGTVDTVHKTLIINTVSEAKLVSDLVAQYGTASHQEILLSFRIVYAIPGWIITTERERGHTFGETSPAKAETPPRTWIQVFICNELHRIGVLRTISGHRV